MTAVQPEIDEVDITSRLLNLILDMPVEGKLRLIETLDTWGNGGTRKHRRVPWVTPVRYAAGDSVYKDFIKDISKGGVFIETRTPLAVGQRIRMNFRLPKTRRLVQAAGSVVRTSASGIAIQFHRNPPGPA